MKSNFISSLTQMYFQKLHFGDYRHKDLLMTVNSVVEIDNDPKLRARVERIKRKTTEELNIPMPVLSGWYERNKMNLRTQPLLIYDHVKYSIHFVELQLFNALEELTDIMTSIVDKYKIEVKVIDLNKYNVD